MKNLLWFLPVFLIACSGENKNTQNVPDQHALDSLSAVVDTNNALIQTFIDRIPKVNGVLMIPPATLQADKNFDAHVYLAARISYSGQSRPDISVDGVQLPVTSNVALYKAKATTEGRVTYSGIIKFASPDGTVNEKPFTGNYYVSASAPAAAMTNDELLDSIFPGRWEINPGGFPGHRRDYKTWVSSTLDFDPKRCHNLDSMNTILSRQDSIISAFRSEPQRTLKFDDISVVIFPVASVVKPGDEYQAFIYLCVLSTTQELEVNYENKTATIRNGGTISLNAGDTGVHQLNGSIMYMDADNGRDSIPLLSQWFVE